jgi:hypothetical protein
MAAALTLSHPVRSISANLLQPVHVHTRLSVCPHVHTRLSVCPLPVHASARVRVFVCGVCLRVRVRAYARCF